MFPVLAQAVAAESAAANVERLFGIQLPAGISSDMILGTVKEIVLVILIFLVGKWLAGRFAKLAKAAMKRAKVDATLTEFGGNLVRWSIMVVVVLAILGRFGVETTSLVAVLGAAGFAIGLALQGTLSNFSSGVMLLLFRPFDVGDVIDAGGNAGRVISLGIFATILGLPNGARIHVPNGAIYGSVIKNNSPGGERIAVAVDVGIDYGADMDQATAVILEAIGTIEGVIEGSTAVVVVGLGASSVDLSVRAACHPDVYWGVMEAMTRASKKALDAVGIGIPYQTVDLNILQMPPRG